MLITSIYSSLLAFVFVYLSVRTLRLRRRLRIGIGDGGNQQMLRAMRVHSNFSEYVPLALIALFLVETSGASYLLVHFLGGALLVGRISHAYGVSKTNENFFFRVSGMALTFTSILSSACYLLISAILR
jgi:uncharacterized membrane protein YecN with MAPEG domain